MNEAVEDFRRLASEYCALIERPKRDRLELVKQGLLALESGAAEADVVFSWRHGFASHWGRHAVNALAGVHDYYW